MKYANLGKTGTHVSRICLGCMSFGNRAAWQIETKEAQRIVDRAIDLGINFFDTADSYSMGRSEEILGNCLKDCRNEVVIATKVGYPSGTGLNDVGLSRRHMMQQVRASLSRLKTDCIDLYQIHGMDFAVPVEDAMMTLNDIVRNGMAYYVGASNLKAGQFQKALQTSERLGLARFVSMQNHYNLVYREEEREMIPLCAEEGIAILPWSPLARGFLTGKYRRSEHAAGVRYESDKYLAERYFRPEDFDVLEAVEALAKEKDASPAQIALAWLFHTNVTAPIIGATKAEHIEEAAAALDIKLSPDETQRLEAPYRPHPTSGLEGLRA